MTVRTRFAPSPTGFLHIGGLRTALFCWLYARRHAGQFVLRIEDTDLERSTPEAIQQILDGLEWARLVHDEGPFYQTKRFDRYKDVIEELLATGKAYLDMVVALTRNTKVINFLGLPTISVPCGFTSNGLPTAFQLFGRPLQEAALLRAADRYQQATDWHAREPGLAAGAAQSVAV